MPTTNKNSYTSKKFQNDLSELEEMIQQNQSGGKKSSSIKNNNNNNINNKNKKISKNMGKYEEEDEDEDEDEDDEDDEEEEEQDESDDESFYGGAKRPTKAPYEGPMRHFKLVEINGKPVNFESKSSIRQETTKDHKAQRPAVAAKRILRSIAKHNNLKGENKVKLNIVFSIQETTRNFKSYGKVSTYKGKYIKLTTSEMKKAQKASNKKEMPSGISPKIKGVITKHIPKIKNTNAQKGG